MTSKGTLYEMTEIRSESRLAYYSGYRRAEREMIIVVIFWGVIGLVIGFIFGYGLGVK